MDVVQVDGASVWCMDGVCSIHDGWCDVVHTPYGVDAEGVTWFLAGHFLLAHSRSTRAGRMCRVALVILRSRYGGGLKGLRATAAASFSRTSHATAAGPTCTGHAP